MKKKTNYVVFLFLRGCCNFWCRNLCSVINLQELQSSYEGKELQL